MCICDEETGLYYLRCRYYCGLWKRFVNSDDLITDRNNQFAYCSNQPISIFDPNGAEGEIIYNRDRVISYGMLYYNEQDPFYPPRSYRSNCARFASQCLYAGLEDPDRYYNQWHCYKKGSNNTKEDPTKSWRLTNPFFNFLLDSNLGRISARIDRGSDVANLIKVSDIREGDFLFFTKSRGSEDDFYHVAVVSWVRNNELFYMGNTTDCFDKPLTDFFLEHPQEEVAVVRIMSK